MAQRKVNCEVYTDRGIVGKEGTDGKSAYQQAVEGGYQGTEEEFEQALASDISVVADNITNINSVVNNIENVNTAADNMAAIIAAPTAATQAAASASQAATSATNAQTSETNAATNASNAAASASNASVSATTATTKASEATSSATSASASADSASESATIATTQAELAKEYVDSIDLSNYRTASDQDIIDATKQDTLVSGTNIKTVNGNSLLGSGNVDIDALPSQTGQSGKFLTTDGTDASWSSVNALQNTATGTNSLTILGTAATDSRATNIGDTSVAVSQGTSIGYGARAHTYSVAVGDNAYTYEEYATAIGKGSTCTSRASVTIGSNSLSQNGSQNVAIGSGSKIGNSVSNGTAIGYSANATGSNATAIGKSAEGSVNATAIGYQAKALNPYCIQIGQGTNSTENTLSVGLGNSNNYQLLDANGKIPSARMPDTIADTSLSNLTDAGKIVGAELGMPSTTTKSLTIGASGTTYTAPANGWVSFSTWTTSTQVAYFQLANLTTDIGILLVPNQGAGYQQKGYIPCRKGDTIYLAYGNLDMSRSTLKFVYAEGSKSEA